jgi:hypothetical protein
MARIVTCNAPNIRAHILIRASLRSAFAESKIPSSLTQIDSKYCRLKTNQSTPKFSCSEGALT